MLCFRCKRHVAEVLPRYHFGTATSHLSRSCLVHRRNLFHETAHVSQGSPDVRCCWRCRIISRSLSGDAGTRGKRVLIGATGFEPGGAHRPEGRRRAPSGAARPPAVRATRGAARRGERPRQVLAHLERNPGARPSEIASAIKALPNQVHSVIAKLRTDKLVRKHGKGYGLARSAKASTQAKSPARTRRSKAKGSRSRRQSAET